MAAAQERLTIDFSLRRANVSLWVAHFLDNGHFVAFVPSLNLSAYGPSKEEASKMLFEDVITDYFDSLLRLSEYEIIKELSQYGWKRSKILRKKFTNTSSIDSKGIIRNFNLPLETVISHHMVGEFTAAA